MARHKEITRMMLAIREEDIRDKIIACGMSLARRSLVVSETGEIVLGGVVMVRNTVDLETACAGANGTAEEKDAEGHLFLELHHI